METRKKLPDGYGGSLIFSWGKYGGFYIAYRERFMKRICLGWFAITYLPEDFDALIGRMITRIDGCSPKEKTK